MRLRLELPADAVEAPGENVVVVTFAARPWLRLELSPLVVTPDDRARFVEPLLGGAATTPPATVSVLGATRTSTRLGWPVELVETAVTRGAEPLEQRLVAVYDLLGHSAAIVARATDRARFAAELQSWLVPLLASARPDWRARVPAALAELWSLDVTPPGS